MKKSLLLTILLLSLLITAGSYAQSSSSIVDLIKQGKTEEARRLLVKMEKDKYSPDLLLFLSGLLSTKGDEAVKKYNKLITQYPDSPYSDDALFRIAQHKYALGLYNQAKSNFLLILKKYSQTSLKPKCLYWSGLSTLAMGQQDSALSYFNTIIKKYPASEMKNAAETELAIISGTKNTSPKNNPNLQKSFFSIQVGAFTRQQNAILRKSFFEKKGYQVQLSTKEKEGTKFYLVWVGKFSTRDQAILFGEKLKKKFGLKYTIIKK